MHQLTPSSAQVLAVPVHECGEPLVDIKLLGGLQYGPAPECPETQDDYTWVREGIYSRLLHAQSLLPAGIYLRLYEGYRSLIVQKMLFNDELQRVQRRQPGVSVAALFDEATRMVSAVAYPDGTLNIPPHNTGAAVDLFLVDDSGTMLDVGMDIYRWTETEPDLCLTHATGISDLAMKNRVLLNDVMTRAGFVNYLQEWWHFSYGDRFWAYLSGHDHAIYGGISHR
ncbi:D-alanyl-D-alanine dipeptidase [Amphritea atlantica]|uniref:D-alanyl-D-alanine dipeptidase n=1 Tax=Amphritea atlantica TaxID=355243 RepID=A0A1H9CRY3_9GAMM|nr:M15 family metallopeptidase [Amphritea atlantica]SEQ03817.1 D-alanyl-D-alanine dipeptidase [Amphritea atlantica]